MATNQVTRCPHCRSVFRVLPEQLAQAQGWLRCGQCQELFDSTGLVLTLPEDEASAPRVDLNDFLQAEDRGAPAPATPQASLVLSPHPVAADTAVNNSASEALLSFEQALASFPTPEVPVPNPGQDTVDAAAMTDASETNPRRVRWGVITLFVLLLLQLLWAMRAWWQTDSVGALAQRGCEWVHCSVPALSDAEQLLIDGSRLVRTDEGYRVEWTLRNRSSWPQRAPTLELTLMDEGGNVLVRRVVQPAEMSAPDRLEPAQAWEAVLALQWPQEQNVSGYKLLIFYP